MKKTGILIILLTSAVCMSLMASCKRQEHQVITTADDMLSVITRSNTNSTMPSIELFHIEETSQSKTSVVDLWLPKQQPLCDSVFTWYLSVDHTLWSEDDHYTHEGMKSLIEKVFDEYPGDDSNAIESYLEPLYEDENLITFSHTSGWEWSPWGGRTNHGATFRKSDGRHLRYMDYFRYADGLKPCLSPFNLLKWDNQLIWPDSLYAAYDAPFPMKDILVVHDSIVFIWPCYALGYGMDGPQIKSMSIDKAAEYMTPEGLAFLNRQPEKANSCKRIPAQFDYKTFRCDPVGMDFEVPEFMTLRSAMVDSTVVFAFNDYNYMLVSVLGAETFVVEETGWSVSRDTTSMFKENDQLVYRKELWRKDGAAINFELHYESKYSKTFDDVIKRMLVPIR